MESNKRKGNDPLQDPDYPSTSANNSKRQRLDIESAQADTCERLRRVLRSQFEAELRRREETAALCQSRVHEARQALGLVRYLAVTDYYRAQAQAPQEQPRLHPAVKKLLGKNRNVSMSDLLAPGGSVARRGATERRATATKSRTEGSDLCVSVKTEPAEKSQEPLEPVQPPAERPSVIPRYVPPKEKEAFQSISPPRATALRKKQRLVVGNVSKFLLEGVQDGGATHKWMVYVRGPPEAPDISALVQRVRFFLHASYQPHDVIEVTSPPFHLSRRGWGEFPVRVQIQFKHAENRPLDVIHQLRLDHTYTGLQTLGAETVVDTWLFPPPRAGETKELPPHTSQEICQIEELHSTLSVSLEEQDVKPSVADLELAMARAHGPLAPSSPALPCATVTQDIDVKPSIADLRWARAELEASSSPKTPSPTSATLSIYSPGATVVPETVVKPSLASVTRGVQFSPSHSSEQTPPPSPRSAPVSSTLASATQALKNVASTAKKPMIIVLKKGATLSPSGCVQNVKGASPSAPRPVRVLTASELGKLLARQAPPSLGMPRLSPIRPERPSAPHQPTLSLIKQNGGLQTVFRMGSSPGQPILLRPVSQTSLLRPVGPQASQTSPSTGSRGRVVCIQVKQHPPAAPMLPEKRSLDKVADQITVAVSKEQEEELAEDARVRGLGIQRAFQDSEVALGWLMRSLPIVSLGVSRAYRCRHPYVAPSSEVFLQWPLGKQRAMEVMRAREISRLLVQQGFPSPTVWEIARWSRRHGFTPVPPPPCRTKRQQTRKTATSSSYSEPSAALAWLAGSASSRQQQLEDQLVDVEDTSTPAPRRRTKVPPAMLPVTVESPWCTSIRRLTAQVGVSLPPADEGTVAMPQDALVEALELLGEDLVRRAYAAAWQRNEGRPDCLEVNDVRAAISSRTELADLLSNHGLGVEMDAQELSNLGP